MGHTAGRQEQEGRIGQEKEGGWRRAGVDPHRRFHLVPKRRGSSPDSTGWDANKGDHQYPPARASIGELGTCGGTASGNSGVK